MNHLLGVRAARAVLVWSDALVLSEEGYRASHGEAVSMTPIVDVYDVFAGQRPPLYLSEV